MNDKNTAPSTESTTQTVEKMTEKTISETPENKTVSETETTSDTKITSETDKTPTNKPKKKVLGIIAIIIAVLLLLCMGIGTAMAFFAKDTVVEIFDSLSGSDSESTDDDSEESATSTDEATLEEGINEILEGPANIKLIAWTWWNDADNNHYLYAMKDGVTREIGSFATSVVFMDWIDDDHFAIKVTSDDYTADYLEVYDWDADTLTTIETLDPGDWVMADFLSPDVFIYKTNEYSGEGGDMMMEISYWMNDNGSSYQLTSDTKENIVYGREGILYDSITIKLSPDGQYFFDIDTGASSNIDNPAEYYIDIYALDHDDGMYWAEYVATIESATYPFWIDDDSVGYFGNPSPRFLMQYDIDSGATTELGELASEPHIFSYNPAVGILLYAGDDFLNLASNTYQFDLASGDNLLFDTASYDIWAGDNTVIRGGRVACADFCGLTDFESDGFDVVNFSDLSVEEVLVEDGWVDVLSGY